MEIVLGPPTVLYAVAIGIPAVMASVLLLARWVKRISWSVIIPVLLLTVALSTVVFTTAGAPRRFSWGPSGIHDDTFGAARDIAWSDIQNARLVPSYLGSELRPTLRTYGSGYPEYRAGQFRLSNGMDVRVFLMNESPDALLVETRDARYLFAPDHFDDFLATVRRFVPLASQ